jgi:biopolymer transport protein ExbD
MNLKRGSKYSAEVYTGSLNDIMFFLLLFFLIISTLVNPSVIKLLLPKAATSQAITKQQFALSVTKDKRYFLNNKEIAFDNMDKELLNATKNVNEATIVLRMDNALTVQDMVDVLQIGNKLKLRMVLATKTTAQ